MFLSPAQGSVLLLPHGLPDILRYTRQENMTYEIAGPALMEKTNGKKIDMNFEGAFTDPSTSVRILVHRQMPTVGLPRSARSGLVCAPDAPH